MNRLINAGFHELLKSKYFYITMLVCAGFGALFSVGMYLYPNFDMPENSQIFINQDNVLGIIPSFATVVVPFAASVSVAFMLDSQYNHGTIRNRLIAGHTRTETFFSNIIVMTIATVIYFACYMAVVFFVGRVIWGYEGYKLKASLVTLSIMLVMIICNGTLLSLVIGNLMRGGKIIVAILAIQYVLNMTMVFGMFKDNDVLAMLARIFPQSSLFEFSYAVVIDGLEKNLFISLALMAVLTVFGLVYFKKCDIK
ncbi:MAG: ABC transporter permease [Lachnospiraceae bacterium]|nr:ABC transporter permease [Lachnospiraceae bacterium]